jgi:mannose-6-phosphate isomerase-like protein (cupin superfamily)
VSMTPFSVQAGEGAALQTPTGDVVTVKVDTAQSMGAMTVLEFLVQGRSGPAVHRHLREDELWWVLEGDFRFMVGDDWLEASTGGMAFGPRGVPHAFQNVGNSSGRLLVVTTPSGLERFFEQFAELGRGPVGPEELAGVAQPNWMEFHGPPLGVSHPL